MPKGAKGRTHGILATYNAGCRCEACKTACRVYYRRKNGHRAWGDYVAAVDARHATESRYARGCRCDECRRAAAAGRRRRRQVAAC